MLVSDDGSVTNCMNVHTLSFSFFHFMKMAMKVVFSEAHTAQINQCIEKIFTESHIHTGT